MQEVAKVLAESYPQASQLPSTSTSSPSNNLKNTSTSTKTMAEVQRIARLVAEKLNNPSRYRLYCKYAWRLSEAQIWRNLEEAQERGRKRREQGKTSDVTRLFTWLCEQELVE